MAWRSSRFSRSSAFNFSATSLGTPARLPASTSVFLTHSFSVWAVQPIFSAIDTIAERIRALGEFAPQGYRTFANLSSISDGDPENGADGMLKTLVGDHETVIATARAALAAAQEADDEASAGIVSDRLEAHEKHAWMLRATLGGK